MFNRGKEKHRFFEKFISANPDTGGHFNNGSSASDEIINGEDKDAEELDTAEEEEGERSTMHLLGRRNLSSSINNRGGRRPMGNSKSQEFDGGPMDSHFIGLGLLRTVFGIAVACREGPAPTFSCIIMYITRGDLPKIVFGQ